MACDRFLRHAFFGTEPRALQREAVHRWLQSHLGGAADEALEALEQTLGAFRGSVAGGAFVFGQGAVEAWYKPLLFRGFMEAQRWMARRRLRQQGFQESKDPDIPHLSASEMS